MNTRNKLCFVLIGAMAALARTAMGAQPPDVVQTDAGANTAAGSNAFLTTGSLPKSVC